MKTTTLNKLVSKIKDFTFYRIAFFDEKRVWVIGEKKSYIKKVIDQDGCYYHTYLNARQTISISAKDENGEVTISMWPDLSKQIDESCEETNNYFYMFDSAECIDVIDFEGFDTPDRFFEDILRNLDNVLKNRYSISIEDFSSGQYFESPFGKEGDYVYGTLYELAAYKPDMTGIEISCLLYEPVSDCGFVRFKKLNNIKESHESVAISYPITDPKKELLNLIKKAMITSSNKSPMRERGLVDKGSKWINAKTK